MLGQAIREGRLTIGSWITIGHPIIAEIFARAGADWVVIDLEHSVIPIDVAGELIRSVDLCGASPLVRLTSNDPDQIKRVMDAGAHGIVVPMVNSAEEAQRAVMATRYAPRGTRGVGLGRAQGYGPGFSAYFEWQAQGPVVIVQIESAQALVCVEEILSVPDVDGFIIGPYDLSCSLGIPGQFEHALYRSAVSQILEAGKRLGVAAGLHIVEPDLRRLRSAIEEGYTFIAYSVDMRFLDVAAREAVRTARELVP